ncbi:amidase [uncultured Paludibaculum sp.]|uniref:amidase n=1 Tax=uncultured Paludibaculum sp. TaxID=1765020 RepID=UPI002AAAB919|nr:amidase [uncultured Paludibaculum sp.]
MFELLGLSEMAAAVEQGSISPLELTNIHLQAIEAKNPRVNAFIEVYAEEAIDRAGTPLTGPLAGVPVTVKDSFDIAGRVTNCGSLLRADAVATRHSNVVDRLLNAGAILIGKTSTPEFLYYYETDNRLIGRTNHPLDEARTSGGSSGGEAAAIASGMSAGGVGSDGGGSIREPAHFCGICGLKPTPGRVGAGGHWPEIAHPTGFMGVAGPMARTAADVRLLFEVLAGYDPRDPFSAPVPLQSQSARRARIFVITGYKTELACTQAPHKAAVLLNELGHSVEEFPFALLSEAHDLWRLLFVDYLTAGIRDMVQGREDDCDWTGLELTRYARETIDASRLGRILLERDRMRARLLEFMGNDAVLIAPAFGVTAFPHRQCPMDLMDAIRPVSPANLLGLPALVLPMVSTPEGMPAGVQLIGAPWTDELLLDLAVRLEHARGSQWLTPKSLPTTTTNTTTPTA